MIKPALRIQYTKKGIKIKGLPSDASERIDLSSLEKNLAPLNRFLLEVYTDSIEKYLSTVNMFIKNVITRLKFHEPICDVYILLEKEPSKPDLFLYLGQKRITLALRFNMLTSPLLPDMINYLSNALRKTDITIKLYGERSIETLYNQLKELPPTKLMHVSELFFDQQTCGTLSSILNYFTEIHVIRALSSGENFVLMISSEPQITIDARGLNTTRRFVILEEFLSTYSKELHRVIRSVYLDVKDESMVKKLLNFIKNLHVDKQYELMLIDNGELELMLRHESSVFLVTISGDEKAKIDELLPKLLRVVELTLNNNIFMELKIRDEMIFEKINANPSYKVISLEIDWFKVLEDDILNYLKLRSIK